MKFHFKRLTIPTNFKLPVFDLRGLTRPTWSSVNWRRLAARIRRKAIIIARLLIQRVRAMTQTQRWITVVVATGLLSFMIGFNARNYIPVATVNGEPVDRKIFSDRLFRQAGEGVLNEFISETLVKQEAKKQNLKVTDKEVDDKITEVEKLLTSQGMAEQAKLSQNPKTRPELEREIRNQLLIEKLFGKNIKVTDEDIDNYFKNSRVKRGEGAIFESQKITLQQLLYQKKLRERFLTWLNLQKRDARVRVLVR